MPRTAPSIWVWVLPVAEAASASWRSFFLRSSTARGEFGSTSLFAKNFWENSASERSVNGVDLANACISLRNAWVRGAPPSTSLKIPRNEVSIDWKSASVSKIRRPASPPPSSPAIPPAPRPDLPEAAPRTPALSCFWATARASACFTWPRVMTFVSVAAVRSMVAMRRAAARVYSAFWALSCWTTTEVWLRIEFRTLFVMRVSACLARFSRLVRCERQAERVAARPVCTTDVPTRWRARARARDRASPAWRAWNSRRLA